MGFACGFHLKKKTVHILFVLYITALHCAMYMINLNKNIITMHHIHTYFIAKIYLVRERVVIRLTAAHRCGTIDSRRREHHYALNACIIWILLQASAAGVRVRLRDNYGWLVSFSCEYANWRKERVYHSSEVILFNISQCLARVSFIQ